MAEESKIENYFKEQWKTVGGICRKVKWIGRRNAPDDYVSNVVWQGFIEFKAPGKKPRIGQLNEIKELRESGTRVEVIDTFEKVNTFISRVKREMNK